MELKIIKTVQLQSKKVEGYFKAMTNRINKLRIEWRSKSV